MTLKHLIIPSLLAISIAACTPKDDTPSNTDTSSVVETTNSKAPVLGTFGVALDNMDMSVEPGTNFYEYVNGTWLANTQIPSDRSRYGSFGILRDRAEERVRKIIEDAASKDNPSADEKRIGDFYNAYLDTDSIEAKGLSPLKDDMARIRAAETHEGIAALMADVRLGLDSPVSPFVYIDGKDNDNYITYLAQDGLNLPNRDYYFDESEKGQSILAAYKVYLTTFLTEAGLDNPEQRADGILAFETALAEGHWDPVKRRNRDLLYNKMSRTELKEIAPGMPWDQILEDIGLGDQNTFVLREKSAIENAAKVFAETDVEVLKDYLTVSLISSHTDYLP